MDGESIAVPSSTRTSSSTPFRGRSEPASVGAGAPSAQEPDSAPVFKQHLQRDADWVQSLRCSSEDSPESPASGSASRRRPANDPRDFLSSVDRQLLKETGRKGKRVEANKPSKSWGDIYSILQEEEDPAIVSASPQRIAERETLTAKDEQRKEPEQTQEQELEQPLLPQAVVQQDARHAQSQELPPEANLKETKEPRSTQGARIEERAPTLPVVAQLAGGGEAANIILDQAAGPEEISGPAPSDGSVQQPAAASSDDNRFVPRGESPRNSSDQTTPPSQAQATGVASITKEADIGRGEDSRVGVDSESAPSAKMPEARASTPRALEEFDEEEYQSFAQSMDDDRQQKSLQRKTLFATSAPPKNSQGRLDRVASNAASTPTPSKGGAGGAMSSSRSKADLGGKSVLDGVELLGTSPRGDSRASRNLTYASHSGGNIYDSAIKVLSGGSSFAVSRQLQAEHLRPNAASSAASSIRNDPISNSSSSSTPLESGREAGAPKVMLTSSPPQPRGIHIGDIGRTSNMKSSSFHPMSQLTPAASDFSLSGRASDTQPSSPRSPSGQSPSSTTAQPSSHKTYSPPPSADSLFQPPPFFQAQQAALADRKSAASHAKRAAAVAEANGTPIDSSSSSGAINLMRSLENIRSLQHTSSKPRRAARPLVSSGAQQSESQRASNTISGNGDKRLVPSQGPRNDSRRRPAIGGGTPNSQLLHPHSHSTDQPLSMSKQASEVVRQSRIGRGNGPQYPNRRHAAAENRKFNQPFVAPHFAKAAQARLAADANAALTTPKADYDHMGDGGDDSYNRDLQPSVPVTRMDPDRDAGMGRDPVGRGLFNRSLRLADENLKGDRPRDPRDRHPGSPRRGVALRTDPHAPAFLHDPSTYESPAQRHYRKQGSFIAERRNASPAATTSASTAPRLTSPRGEKSRQRGEYDADLTLGDSLDSAPKHPERQNTQYNPQRGSRNAGNSSGRDKMRNIEALHKRTMELDRLARKLEEDRSRLETERAEIFSLQQSLLEDAGTSPPRAGIHGIERSVPTAGYGYDSLAVGAGSTASYQHDVLDLSGDDAETGTQVLDASRYMTREELDDEFARSSRHLNTEFERSLRSLQRKVGRDGRAPLTKAAVDTLEEASPRRASGSNGNDAHRSTRGGGGGARAPPATVEDLARSELEETLRVISEKRQRRIKKLQELNKSATDFMEAP